MVSRGLRFYTLFMMAATFCLVIAGGLVTSTGSALAVPDWPLSFGKFFPPMVGGVLYEHGHRMIAATVGFLTIILAFWTWNQATEPLLKKAGWIALGLVCAQGILGGVTVLLKLPTLTSVGHACLGQIFFSWMSCIAAMAWSERAATAGSEAAKLRRLALITTGFVFLQLIFGAIYRHRGLMLHAHFLGAALVFIHGFLLYNRVRKTVSTDQWFTRPATLLVALILFQVGLGFYTWRNPSVLDATAHVANGALILAICAVLSLESFRRLAI